MAKVRLKTTSSQFEMMVPSMGAIYTGGMTEGSILNYVLGTTAVSIADILEACGLGTTMSKRVASITVLNAPGGSNTVYVGRAIGGAIEEGPGVNRNGTVPLAAGDSVTMVVTDEDSIDFEDVVMLVAGGSGTDIRLILAEALVVE